jgi:Fe-S-cluster containining protein
MSQQSPRHRLAKELAAAAAAYQTSAVIPHCPSCAAPCCKLDKLVLELDWAQTKGLWRLEESRKEFDKRLAAGRGPIEIRPANGLYYAHSRPCPAFDASVGCTVYTTALKPVGCSDFPVYENEGEIMADLRCEAVDIEALKLALTRDLGPDTRIKQSADRDFPFLVTLAVKR